MYYYNTGVRQIFCRKNSTLKRRKTMNAIIGAEAAKLAGLQIDLLQKIRNKKITSAELEWFNNLSQKDRDLFRSPGLAKSVIAIDRTKPFEPNKFIWAVTGRGNWTISKVKPQDERSLALTKVDLAEVHFKEKGQFEEDDIPLDIKVFETIWENEALIPESWKKEEGIFFYTFFERHSEGSRQGGYEEGWKDKDFIVFDLSWSKTYGKWVVDDEGPFLYSHKYAVLKRQRV